MYLLGLGIILLLMKWQELGPVAAWSWWWVLSPFAGAMVWWAWADWSGYTKRKVMEREDQRRRDRIDRQREAIGQKPKTGASRKR
ncbi:MAG: TIGR04438 family Trp-rich protein [Proteobacteria bacterium]|nr:TIGR04438 family Trp-rich protein [Pseudomonadota bacterium]